MTDLVTEPFRTLGPGDAIPNDFVVPYYLDDLKLRATALFQVVQQTNFPVRAKAIAKEIDANDPDLVGLQEVAMWRRTPDGVTNTVKDANVVVYDFLASLQKEIKARGLHYKAAVTQQEADFEGIGDVRQ